MGITVFKVQGPPLSHPILCHAILSDPYKTSRLSTTHTGSLITTRRFSSSNTTCSGPSIGDTYSVGDCRESIDKDGTYVTGTPVPASVFPFITSANPSSCFSGSDTVALESGGERALSEVRVGDRVLGADAAGRTSYSEVSGVV
jgi:hypothetical protein